MSKSVAAMLAGGLLIGAPAQAQETLVGTWDIVIDRPEGVEDGKLVWTVTETDGEYKVDAVFDEEDEAGANLVATLGPPTLVETDFDGERFTMTTVYSIEAMPDGGTIDLVVVNTGVVDGDTFEGVSSMRLGDSDATDSAMTGTRR